MARAATPARADMAVVRDDSVSRNLNGQRIGRKGRVTRERILAATEELLYNSTDETPISLSAVARQASLGMTSLYNYFSDLTELLLALLEPVMESAEDAYLGQLRAHWPDDELGERCYTFVVAYHDFWARHTRLLHMRNFLSERQDERMTKSRIKATQPIIGLLTEQMGGDAKAARSPEFAMATMLMIGIERSVTISTDSDLPVKMAQDIQHDRDHFLRPGARLMEMAIRDCRSGRSSKGKGTSPA